MFKSILAAVAGYVVMFIGVAVIFSLMWLILGSSFSFKEGTTEVTGGWLTVAALVSIVIAVLGGMVAGGIGGGRAIAILVGIVVVLGIVSAMFQLSGGIEVPEDLDPTTLSFMEAGQYAKQPAWYNFAIPVFGVIGVLIGGHLVRAKTS